MKLLINVIVVVTLFVNSIGAQEQSGAIKNNGTEQTKNVHPSLQTWKRIAARKSIIITDLSLYKLLALIRSNIEHMLHDALARIDTDGKAEKTLLAALDVSNEGIHLMEAIVSDLNTGSFSYNPEVEYQFLKIGNYLKDVDFSLIEPGHIRVLKTRVKEFNRFVTLYCLNRKEFLSKEDFDLFNKMSKFNQILTLCLLNEDYLDISAIDKVLDIMVYRPCEFIGNHPYITMLTLAAIVAAVGYFYVYPRWFPAPNKEYDVTQLEGARQNGNDCGYFAMVNEFINQNAKDEQDAQRMREIFKSDPDKITKPMKDFIESERLKAIGNTIINKHLNDTNPTDRENRRVYLDHHPEERQRIIDEQIRSGTKAVKGMRKDCDDIDRQEIEAILRKSQLINGLSQALHCGANTNLVVVDHLGQGSLFHSADATFTDLRHQEFQQIVNQFRQQVNPAPQHVILRINNDHWVGVSIYPDDTKKHGIRVDVINSKWRDITNNGFVKALLNNYKRKE